jgi:serine/threonine protein kinase
VRYRISGIREFLYNDNLMPNNADPNLPQEGQFQEIAPPQIESVEILELLGKGGMSLVYKARQKQLDRLVAVKVLSRSAVRGEEGIKRFQNEARLTSALEHPNIVKTISFGVSKDEQPYLVMEYLEGLSLADEMKKHGRLQLQKFKDVFLPALSALNQAHQSGMVHRDIKPGNIMLCRTDSGAETVKLVDFGIAKVFGEDGSAELNLTKSGAVIGSPSYMSPEQCLGKPVDGRSDLYSMACVMYETLSGEPPFTGDSLLDVMQKHAAAPPPTVSDLSRKIDIRRELADVTLWGLAKDPADRPQTASDFARKLSEVLERITLDKVPREKNTAGRSSREYRNFALATACAVVLVFVFFFYANQQKKNTRVRHQAQVPKLVRQKKEDMQFEELMAKPIKTAELAEQLDNKGEQYERNSDFLHAEKLFRRAIECREKLVGYNHADLAPSLSNLAHCLIFLHRYAEAETVSDRELRIRQSSLEPTDQTIIGTLKMLACCCHEQNKHDKEESIYMQQLGLIEKSRGLNDRFLPEIFWDMANCYQQQGKFAKAEPIYKRCLAVAKKEYKSGEPRVGLILFDLARCYVQDKKFKEGEAKAKEALLLLKGCAPDHEQISSVMKLLGFCCLQQGNHVEAEFWNKKALKRDEQRYGVNDLRVVDALFRLVDCYRVQGKYAEATPLLERLVSILEKPGVNDFKRLSTSLNYLAECYARSGKLEQASVMSKRSYALLEAEKARKR